MMQNKYKRCNMNKGFTLVELLAIIVILGFVLAIAVPIVNNLIDESLINSFLAEAQTIYRSSLIFSVDDITDDGVIYSSSGKKLDLSKKEYTYCVKINSNGDVTNITVSNGTYIIEGDSDFLSLDSSDVKKGNMNNFVCE